MLKRELKDILKTTDSLLIKEAAKDLLDKEKCEGEEETKRYIDEVLMYGCVSGIVPKLIYYKDTKKFFTKHMDEILELLNTSINEGIKISEIDTNSMAWFGYEWAMSEINAMIN